MKAITILQPWASLIACGAKKIETRSWATSYRGPIAIHAGKKLPRIGYDMLCEGPIEKLLRNEIIEYGKIIAIANLVDCWAVDGYGHSLNWEPGVNDIEEKHYYAYQSSLIGKDLVPTDLKLIRYPETIFGYYPECGFNKEPRFAWVLDSVRPIDPVSAKGMQRIWNWEGNFPVIPDR